MGAMEGEESAQELINAWGEERIMVSVRLRPLNAKEIERNNVSDWECINHNTIILKNSFAAERSMLPNAYTFDRVFQCDCTTKQVYEEAAKEVALSVIGGINSSIFAYGQTSSGKTYTMSGIAEYTLADIYNYIQKHQERVFVLKFSAMEIYNEAVRDLLSTDATPLRLLDDPERGTIVERLTEETLRDWNHLKELLSICEAQRQIGETCLNETSSRSHQILRLTIESSSCEFLGKENSSALAASVNFVDLAGSERASQALSAGTRLKEGCHINRSLLTLGTVIRKLSKGRYGHIPYRDSKLTRILQSSLGGNARTAIICTMSPARSHIEQSRNTLSFATSAKEVATSAKVNIVMSDKALVKQLQRELARLESELRSPGPTAATSHFEALLKEKEVRIQKMEKEIKELIQQRDLAQSRLEDLLQVVGDDQPSRLWTEFSHPPAAHVPHLCEDELPLSESSGIVDQSIDFGISNLDIDQYSKELIGTDFDEHFLEISEVPGNKVPSGNTSPQHSITSPKLVLSVTQQREDEISHVNSDDYEDICKEVRCIETTESSTGKEEEFDPFSHEGSESPVPFTDREDVHATDHELLDIANKDSESKINLTNVLTEQKLKGAQESTETDVKPCSDESPHLISADFSSSRKSCLNRSRSCRATLMTGSSSPEFLDAKEPNENTPLSVYNKDLFGRPQGFHKRPCALNFGGESGQLSKECSQNSEHTSSSDMLKTQHIRITSEANINDVHSFVAGLTEMAELQYQQKLVDGLEAEPRATEDFTTEKTSKDVGLDPMQNPLESPSHWPLEFERQQREIIDLWNACNVSLVHRTYFFLLFKGDPADSIYMEVELRRLSFLKNMFSQEKLGKPFADDGLIITTSSSMRALRREREVLSKQMLKRFSAEERENLYWKWGIGLDTKQRRLQLARRLWTETRDMDHVRESANIVARLIGFKEPGQAAKEMFSLSFTPQAASRRSFGWKNSMSSLL
ncbi:kinesin-like protein KIN-7E [Cinnamomum micranthum f. kanehirae]|uniref:Kinesin-like protein n=1 Tax=Cinnamomum micranthum f. kanehirae TaxID=337451 RepID=A0A3S3NSY0_9MAGN|nr:kinesin-like protein KIN-7E [Cinnamomum micranthum f. kanehirae]